VGDPIIGFTGRTGLFPENMSHAINCKPDEATLYLTIKNEHGNVCLLVIHLNEWQHLEHSIGKAYRS